MAINPSVRLPEPSLERESEVQYKFDLHRALRYELLEIKQYILQLEQRIMELENGQSTNR